jgi:hypothetical protein
VDPLPPHYRARPSVAQHLAEAVLADIIKPVVVTGTRQTVTLVGMGGVGKPVIAAAFARECRTRRALPDGLLWLHVGPGAAGADPEAIGLRFLSSIAGALDQPAVAAGDFATAKKGEKIRREFPTYPYPDLLRAIGVSVDALSESDREKYLALAVFSQDSVIPEPALEVLFDADGGSRADVHDFVDRIVDRSLARRIEAGIVLHDLQHDYIVRQAGDPRGLHQRLVEAYRRRAANGWPSGPRDGYFFQRLPWHLKQAGLEEELDALLVMPTELAPRRRSCKRLMQRVVTLTFVSWNQIAAWLRRLEGLRGAARSLVWRPVRFGQAQEYEDGAVERLHFFGGE